MSTFTITLPEMHVTTLRSGTTDTLDINKLSEEIIARAVMLGLGTKHRNFSASSLMNCRIRAAGAKRNDETEEGYAKRLDKVLVSTEELNTEALACMVAGRERLYAGEWGAERTSNGAPDLDNVTIDWASVTYRAALIQAISGFAELKAGPRRIAVDTWLDAKDGRRATIEGKMAAEKVAAFDI